MVFTRIKKDVLEILYAHNIWWHDFFFQDYDYERDEVNKILDLLKNSDDIIVLQGIRGIGKTVIIKQAIKKLLNYGIEPTNILYIPLENSLLSSLTIENIINVYQQYVCRAETSYYFIDEPFLSKTSDFNNISNLTNGSKVVVAQSFNNVKQVRKKNISKINVYPLSFIEYCDILDLVCIDNDKKFDNLYSLLNMQTDVCNSLCKDFKRVGCEFENYLFYGGFPYIDCNDADFIEVKKINQIINTIMSDDMGVVFSQKHIDKLKYLYVYICGNSADIFSNLEFLITNKGYRKKYIDYLVDNNLVYKVMSFDNNRHYKLYLTSNSIQQAVLCYCKDSITMNKQMQVETTIYHNLLKLNRSLNIKIGFYTKSQTNHDICLIYHDDNRIFIKIIGNENPVVKIFDDYGRNLTLKSGEFLYILGLLKSL